MSELAVVRLAPETDIAVYTEIRGHYSYRYAWARSNDSRQNNDLGQDYLVIREDGERLVFALCDGVSQSFFGNLAAQLLGEALAGWLWEIKQVEKAKPEFLQHNLQELAKSASQQVSQQPLPENLPEMVRVVLEQKRSLGSESVFVAGLVDLRQQRLFLTWMGDSRARLWSGGNEISDQLGETFLTKDRWSSKHGLLGELRTANIPLENITRLAVYSDGLAYLDDKLPTLLPEAAINQAIIAVSQLSTSDDATFFEIWFSGERPLPDPFRQENEPEPVFVSEIESQPAVQAPEAPPEPETRGPGGFWRRIFKFTGKSKG